MPASNGIITQRFYKGVNEVLPTVTNANNVSICCGCWQNKTGGGAKKCQASDLTKNIRYLQAITKTTEAAEKVKTLVK
jgi:hypothetical protein